MKLFHPCWRTWICLIQVVAFALSCSLSTGCSRTEKPEAKKGPSKPGEKPEESKVLRVLTPENYIAPQIVKAFADKHKVKVQLDTYQEKGFEKLWKAGQGGYDLVLPPQEDLLKLLEKDQVAELDKTALPNLKHVDPKLVGPHFDKEGKHTVPWFFTPLIALGVRTDKVTKPVKGLEILSDEEYKGHIGITDAPDQIVPTYLFHLNSGMTDLGDANLAKVKELLLKQRPLVKEFSTESFLEKLRKGDVWLALDLYTNLSASLTEEDRKNIRLVIPSSGVPLWVDFLCVAKDSSQPDLAFQFLNHLLDPEMSHLNAAETTLATVNRTARLDLDPAVRDNSVLYPPAPAKASRLHDWGYMGLDEAQEKKVAELWKEVKAGKK